MRKVFSVSYGYVAAEPREARFSLSVQHSFTQKIMTASILLHCRKQKQYLMQKLRQLTQMQTMTSSFQFVLR